MAIGKIEIPFSVPLEVAREGWVGGRMDAHMDDASKLYGQVILKITKAEFKNIVKKNETKSLCYGLANRIH